MSNTQTFWTKYGSDILTGVSIVCGIVTPILAANATPKALAAIEEANAQTVPEKIKAGWKPYIPAMITGTVGVAADIMAKRHDSSRIAALASAYNNATQAYKAIDTSAKDILTEQKYDEVKTTAAKKLVEAVKDDTKTLTVETGFGDSFFIDEFSGQRFRSNIETIRQIKNNLNERLLNGDDVYLNEWYTEMALGHVAWGWDLKWSGCVNGVVEKISIDIKPDVDNMGNPVGVIIFNTPPKAEARNRRI